jgi:acetyltransferase-like isoleucine patch superfamily enzyme
VSAISQLKRWLKTSNHPLAKRLFGLAKALLRAEIPVIRPLHGLCYTLHRTFSGLISETLRIFYWTPLFKSRIVGGKHLYLYGGMPYLSGPLHIQIGQGSRVSGQTTFSGRTVSTQVPELIVGDNVDIGWQTTIAVGRKVVIGNNTRIAGQGFIAGYPGHPIDPIARAAGAPDLDEQVGDVILEDDVWLATRVCVMAGVTIGRGTIVAAGSVVTKSLPPNVLAGGCPARVIKQLVPATQQDHAHA